MKLDRANAIILLGRVDSLGNLTIDAYERIRYAAELFFQGYAPFIVATAKWHYSLPFIPPQTEASTIKVRLLETGVPEEAIICEEKSKDTLGTAYFIKKDFAVPANWTNIIVVTSLDHLKRTQYVFHKVFGDSITLQYATGKKVLGTEAFKAISQREARSLKLMQNTWVGPVKPGDDGQIEAIFKLHPGYSKTPELSSEEIERKIQSQNISDDLNA